MIVRIMPVIIMIVMAGMMTTMTTISKCPVNFPKSQLLRIAGYNMCRMEDRGKFSVSRHLQCLQHFEAK